MNDLSREPQANLPATTSEAPMGGQPTPTSSLDFDIKRVLPSVSYEAARDTLVYRMSELVFGSLLASYILGFMSVSAVEVANIFITRDLGDGPVTMMNWTAVERVATNALISGTYAYLTAATYLRYHTGILPLPTLDLRRNREDFLIAVLQAFMFGFSMLIPDGVLLFFGVVMIAAWYRHHTVHTGLIEWLEETSRGVPSLKARDHDTQRDNRRESIRKKVSESGIEGWAPISGRMKLSIISVIFIGSALATCLWPPKGIVSDSGVRAICQLIASVVMFASVFYKAHGILKKNMSLIEPDSGFDELDKRFLKMWQEVLSIASKKEG